VPAGELLERRDVAVDGPGGEDGVGGVQEGVVVDDRLLPS